MEKTEKTYIGKVEALEIALERNIYKLPRKNKEILTVYAKYLNKNTDVLGKDINGFYICEYLDSINSGRK